MPRHSSSQQLTYHKIICEPIPKQRSHKIDDFGNNQHEMIFNRPIQKVDISSVMKISVINVPERRGDREFEQNSKYPLWNDLFADHDLQNILHKAKKFAEDIFIPGCDIEEALIKLMNKIFEQFTYDANATSVNTPLIWLFENRLGVCQDFSRIMIAVLQAYGLATRYISGYLYAGVEGSSDTIRQSASHAWVSVYVPDTGWVDLDPTNNKRVDENYITLAWGRDYVDVVPVKGILNEDRQQQIDVSVTIERQIETI